MIEFQIVNQDIEEILPSEFIYINIEKDLKKGENYRKITIKTYPKENKRYKRIYKVKS